MGNGVRTLPAAETERRSGGKENEKQQQKLTLTMDMSDAAATQIRCTESSNATTQLNCQREGRVDGDARRV